MDKELLKCKICDKKALKIVEAGELNLCAEHYVEKEDEESLKAYLSLDIDENGKITESREIQLEIKNQKPKLYEELEHYFSV